VRIFIVRLQEDAGGSGRTGATDATGLRLRGVVDEVATGLRATFRNDQELVTALKAAVGADTDPPSPPWVDGDLSAGRPSSDRSSSDRPPQPVDEET
jgi:hypothetical protein